MSRSSWARTSRGRVEAVIDDAKVSLTGGDLTLDPEPLVRDAIALELPFAPLCSPTCRGLCPRCGGDRNLGECSCTEAIDPRWAALERFRED